MVDVLCVGIATIDRIFAVRSIPQTPAKYRAEARLVTGGGVAANAAVTIARQGGRARIAGAVGDDDAGVVIARDLSTEGVNVDLLQVVPGRDSPESVVFVDDRGERLVVNHASPDLFDRLDPPAAAMLGAVDSVLVDMRWPSGSEAGLEAARRRSVPGVLDCDHDPTESPRLLKQASHVIFALPTLQAFTDQTDPGEALRAARRWTTAWVAATAGPRGVYWLEGDVARHMPALEVEVVDTLGAGDVFHGVFALEMGRGSSEVDAIRLSSAAAALKCTRFGGRAAIPTKAELDRFLEGKCS